MRCSQQKNKSALHSWRWLLAGLVLVASSGWADSLGVSWQRSQAADVESGLGTEVSVSEIAINGDFFQWQGNKERLKVGANAVRTDFSWAGSGLEAMDDSLYWLGVTLDYRQKRSNSMEFLAKLEPGLMADRDNLDSKSFTANAQLSGRYYASRAHFVEAGVIVDRSFGTQNAYPLFALGWKPDAVTEVKLGFPYSEIHAAWNKEFSTYARLKPAGGLWKVGTMAVSGLGGDDGAGDGDAGGGDDGAGDGGDIGGGDDGAGDDTPGDNNVGGINASSGKKVAYKSWQVGAGAQLHWRDSVWLNAEAGMLFDRSLEAAGIESKVKNGMYWQVGIKVQF